MSEEREDFEHRELVDSSDDEAADYNIKRFQPGHGPDKIIIVPDKPKLQKTASELRLEMLCKKTTVN